MTREKIIEVLSELYKELSMSPSEYAEYANEKYFHESGYKVVVDSAMAFRSGVVQERIKYLIREVKE